MNYIISLSATTTFFVAVAFSLLLILGSMLLLFIFQKQGANPSIGVPVPPFIGAVTTVWALSLGFVAADIWSVNARAENWASQERSAIARLAGTASSDALNSPALMIALHDYTVASTEHEWKELANREPAPEVDSVLQRIRVEIVSDTFRNLPTALVNKLVNDFDRLQDARDVRLGIGARSINSYKWYLVFSLTVLSLVTIAITHADKPVAGRNAIIIFTLSASVSLWILVLHANPYLGVEGILPGEVNILPFPVPEAAG